MLFDKLANLSISDTLLLFLSVVFSCWAKSLELVSATLHLRHIQHVRIDGSSSTPERPQAMARFHDDPALSILLMTTGTGAVG